MRGSLVASVACSKYVGSTGEQPTALVAAWHQRLFEIIYIYNMYIIHNIFDMYNNINNIYIININIYIYNYIYIL